jgi:hypothetical protein
LRASDGSYVRGRCRATNLCAYCAKLAAVETSEVLAIDAMTHSSPALWAVLTTRTASVDPSDFYAARWKLQRALKRRWPDVQYAALVEFTTGYGKRSGGVRRPHWNLLLKGIPMEDEDLVHAVITKVWCGRVDAKPAGQYVGTIAEAGGLMRYLSLHFQKESQAPPKGWRGHRFICSRGYFSESIAAVRERAREQLRFRREVHALQRQLERDLPGILFMADEVDQWAMQAHERKRALSWDLVRVRPTSSPPQPPRRVRSPR